MRRQEKGEVGIPAEEQNRDSQNQVKQAYHTGLKHIARSRVENPPTKQYGAEQQEGQRKEK